VDVSVDEGHVSSLVAKVAIEVVARLVATKKAKAKKPH
jgi:hypothetical protein